jgi:hypothetical protein
MKVKHLKKLMLLGITVLGLSILSIPARAQVNIQVGIQLPPALVFSSPPEMVVLPGTYVYVVPDSDQDVFFFDGWWWRPWNGHWYRSQYYDQGWGYYSSVPSFYQEVPQDWRNDYREHRWGGQPWNYERMPHDQVEKNWSGWQKDKYWEKQKSWGVQGYKPKPQAQTHVNYQKPEQKPQAKASVNNQHAQTKQPQEHAQSSQAHQVKTQQPPNQQPQAHVQQPQAQKQQSQQPNKSQVSKGQGNQGEGQGNKGQGQGNKGEKQQGGEREK